MSRCNVFKNSSNVLDLVCYNEAGRQRRDYKEKPKEAKPLTRNAKRLLLKVKRGEPTN